MNILHAQDLISLAKDSKDKTHITLYLDLGDCQEKLWSARRRLHVALRKIKRVLDFRKGVDNTEKLLRPLATEGSYLLDEVAPDVLGVVFFRSSEKLDVYPVKHRVKDYYTVSDSFHLKPLLNTIQGLSEYYVIAVTSDHVEIFEGDGENRISVAKNYREIEAEESVDVFFLRSAERFRSLLTNPNIPVVLVGPRWLQSEFRRICPLKSLILSDILSSDGDTWAIAKEEFNRRKAEIKSLVLKHKGSEMVSHDISTVAQASVLGRINRLLISEDDHIFGRLNRDEASAEVYSRDSCPYGDDILCDIAQEVLQHGGTAIAIPRREMPSDAPLAATFRW